MRVIGGSLKGRRLSHFNCAGLRPTSDKAREAIFNVIGELEFTRVLDIFAGTGALGIEALSRIESNSTEGQCVFIDDSRNATTIINKNLTATGLTESGRVLMLDAKEAIKLLQRESKRAEDNANAFDLIFLDAPYKEKNLTLDTLKELVDSDILTPDAIIIVECAKNDIDTADFQSIKELHMIKEKSYGDTIVYFFEIS